jgi:long-chain acyl-CoA synthetase
MENIIQKHTLKDYIEDSIIKYPDNPSFGIINGETLTYRQFYNRVKNFSNLLRRYNTAKGDKVALLGGSMPNWPVAYLGITTSGRVVVPLLPDFTAFEIANILEHSESKSIIVSKKLIYKLSDSVKEKLNLIICLDTLEILKGESNTITEEKEESSEATSTTITPDDIASIIYTSGTSGASKGVMLTHGNLTANIQMCYALYPITENDIFLSFLPLSHAYECTLGMLYPIYKGASVVYLDGAPTPSLLLPALQKVRPTIICSVPLIVEKIYKNKVRPMFTNNWAKQFIYSIRPIRRLLHKIAGKKMVSMFGGRVRFFGIGGAKLDGTVEHFLRDGGFPYAIGYGLTECSPLIAGAVNKFKFGTTGPTLLGMEMRIAEQNEKGIGEIQVKGPNIMPGYFKDEAKTKAAFTPDGWFKTKDLGMFDKQNNLYIKGRVDNMIIGANGENIYPEEIESAINENDFVLESLVAKKAGKLVAMVHFNYEQIAALKDYADMKKTLSEKYEQLSEKYSEKYEQLSKKYEQLSKKYAEKYPELVEKWKDYRQKAVAKKNTEEKKRSNKRTKVENRSEVANEEESLIIFNIKLERIKSDILEFVNNHVNKSSKINEIVEQHVPFEKTATQKIKRYLYV